MDGVIRLASIGINMHQDLMANGMVCMPVCFLYATGLLGEGDLYVALPVSSHFSMICLRMFQDN